MDCGGSGMAIKYFTFNTYASGLLWTVTDGDGVYVDSDVTVSSTDNFALSATGATISVDIDGTIYGDLGGLSLTDVSEGIVRVGSHGQVRSDLNDSAAIQMTGFSGLIDNRGAIDGKIGVEVDGAVGGALQNFGSVSGLESAIHLATGSSGTLTFLNSGRIETTSAFTGSKAVYYSQGNVTDAIINVGVINGIVALGNGKDSYFGAQAKAMDGGFIDLLNAIGGTTSAKIGSYVDAGAGDDRLGGSRFIDVFMGDAGKDVLVGAAGDDYLLGGSGKDRLEGDAGKDAFVFSKASDSQGSQFDTIVDFHHKQHDLISLSGIDAKPATAATDDEFKFIGTHGFSGKAGEVRYVVAGGNTFVYANLDHDKQAEFKLELTGVIHLQRSDFDL
jgi:Ca2+-binding RTX toxin-like protein